MSEEIIIVYGANWCWDCRRARRFLDQHGIRYEWIDVSRDKDAEKRVEEINNGMRSIPTIIFPDRSILVEPSNRELAQKLGVAAR